MYSEQLASYNEIYCREAAVQNSSKWASVCGRQLVYFRKNKNAFRVRIIEFQGFKGQNSVFIRGKALPTICYFQSFERARVYDEGVWHKRWCSRVRLCERLLNQNGKKDKLIG